MKIRSFLFVVCLIFIAGSLFSIDLTATVREVKGKVESKVPNGQWVPVKVGDVLHAGDSISTGFNSKAVMVLGNTSVLVAKDLTRLTLSELYKKEDTVVTDLFLDIGNIRSEVHSSSSVANDFRIRSTNTTASVRGTVIDVEVMGDGRDMKVIAWDGKAMVQSNKTKRTTYVGEQKREKDKDKSNETEKVAENSDQESSGEEVVAQESSANFGNPPEPPASIQSAPVIAVGSGGGIISSLSSTISSSSVSVSTKPPSPVLVSTGGGSAVSTDASSVVGSALNTAAMGALKSTSTDVVIKVVWP